MSTSAQADDKPKVFALVPKVVGVPFYADVENGCNDEAKKIGATCLFTGPAQADEAEQNKFVRDLITKGIDGLAVAPNNPASIASVIKAAQAKGIPVVTFDSDAPASGRVSFIGTNNKAGGVEGGKAFRAVLPGGGKFAVITGGLAADNLNQRIAGFKEGLGSGYVEVAGSPFPCNDDANVAIQIIQDVLTKNPDINGFFFAGGWPMFAPEAFSRALKTRQADIKAGKFVVVSFDTLDSQLKLLKEGYATTLIGQRPYGMGARSVDALNILAGKGTVDPIIDTGVDVVSSANVDKFLK
ncbi:MAG TPA: sugar-binding protein [Bradyrhizobium sp.]|nr:sugar-binding protein [Bradyrhizobium sp.]